MSRGVREKTIDAAYPKLLEMLEEKECDETMLHYKSEVCIYPYSCVFASVFVCMGVCVYGCVCVYECVCMGVYVCVCVCVWVHGLALTL